MGFRADFWSGGGHHMFIRGASASAALRGQPCVDTDLRVSAGPAATR